MKTQNLLQLVIFCLLRGTISSFGQSDITIEDLRTSSPPAFTIIGVEPKTISRPSTPRAVAAGIVSSIGENGIKPDISMEVAPYWITKKRNLTFDKYLSPDAAQSFLQTLSISVATKQNDAAADKGTQLGVGFRFQLLPGKISKESAAAIDQAALQSLHASILNATLGLATTRAELKTKIRSVVAELKAGKIVLGPIATLTSQMSLSYLNDPDYDIEGTLIRLVDKEDLQSGESMDSYIRRLKQNFLDSKIPLEIQESLKSRIGWILEIAGANGLTMPQNTFRNSKNNKAGLWANLTYRSKNRKNDFSLLLRYSKAFRDSTISNQDIGISYGYNIKSLSISAEAVFRKFQYEFAGISSENKPVTILEKSDTYRVAVNFDYRVSDTMSLTATIGKNYKNEFFLNSDFLSLLGINFSLPSKQTITSK